MSTSSQSPDRVTDPLAHDLREQIAKHIGDAKPATSSLLVSLAESTRDVREHGHETKNEVWFCLNQTSWAGHKVATVLRRLLDTDAEVDRLRSEVAELEAQRDKLVRWHEEDATELRRLYAIVPPAAASRRCMLHGSSCEGDMEQAHIMQPACRADGAPLLDPRSFDRPGQRAAARMLNDDDYPTFTAAEVASWQKSQGITAPKAAEIAAVCPVCQRPGCCCSCFGKTPRPDCTHGGAL